MRVECYRQKIDKNSVEIDNETYIKVYDANLILDEIEYQVEEAYDIIDKLKDSLY